MIAYVKAEGLKIEWLLETHAHADHLSAAPYLQERLGGRLGIGRGITAVQENLGTLFNAGGQLERDRWQFEQIRRVSCRASVWKSVAITGVAVLVKKKNKKR